MRCVCGILGVQRFLSTPSARRATVFSNRLLTAIIISIHALREEGDTPAMSSSIVEINISIHALREEGDDRRRGCSRVAQHFYPRPPRGGRQGAETPLPQRVGFLSTPSARRATVCRADSGCSAQYFYPRPPRGGRRLKGQGSKTLAGYFYPRPPRGGRRYTWGAQSTQVDFYPRPPRGGRRSCWPSGVGALLFLSTPSARRATAPTPHRARGRSISIHALREEGDATITVSSKLIRIFLSTPSARRATRRWYAIFHPLWTFLSTPSARRATVSVEEAGIDYSHFYPRPPRGGRRSHHRRPTPHREISIHALREEGDLCGPPAPSQSVVFLSTPSARRATFPCLTMFVYRCISIHALREEGDRITPRDSSRVRYFYPRPPRGGRRMQG